MAYLMELSRKNDNSYCFKPSKYTFPGEFCLADYKICYAVQVQI